MGRTSGYVICLIGLSAVSCCGNRAPAKEPVGPAIVWSFDERGTTLGWTPNAHLIDVRVNDGALAATAVGTDPILLGPVFEQEAPPTQTVAITVRSDRSSQAELFWTETLEGPYGGFSQRKSVRFSVVGDNRFRVYRLRPGWQRAQRIVRLRLDPPADSHWAVRRIAIEDVSEPIVSTDLAWRFASDDAGWTVDRGLTSSGHGRDGWRLFTTGNRPTVTSPLVHIDAAEYPIVSIRMSVSAGRRGAISCTGDQQLGWQTAQFPLRSDGRMHTYFVDLGTLRVWTGHVLMLGLQPTDEASAHVVIESIQVAAAPSGPGELVVDYFGSAEGVCRVGRAFTIVCQVRNAGGKTVRNARLRLTVPENMVVVGPEDQQVDAVSLFRPQRVRWQVMARQPGAHKLSLNIAATDVAEVDADATCHATPLPMIPQGTRPESKIGYVPEPQPVRSDIDVGMYYFPGWPTLTRWRPIFDYPGRRPVLGWYDESNPECADWQIKWAAEHGVRFFMVDWYWSAGRRQLDHWVHSAYQRSQYREHLKWAVMWANHNRPFTHSVDDWRAVTAYWIKHYFRTPEYYQIDGRPAVFIWAPANIRRDLGGSANAARLYTMSQQMARKAGLKGIYFVAMSSHETEASCRQLEAEGYDAFTSYHAFQLAAARAGGRDATFAQVVETAPEVWRDADRRAGDLHYFPLVDTGWDARPWHKQQARVVSGRTPELFERLCRAGARYARDSGKTIVTVGPCNEWGEGSYIEPCAEYGFKYLDALRAAFCPPDGELAGRFPPNLVPADVGRGPYDLPDQPLQSHWTFNQAGDFEGWTPNGPLKAHVQNGLLIGQSTGEDPVLSGPAVELEADLYTQLVLRVRVDHDERAQLFWATSVSPASETQSLSVALRGDGAFHEYRLDLAAESRWRGLVTQIRLDPVAQPGRHFAIDSIHFE